MATLGERLRELIRETGMDQKTFAEKFGMKTSTLNGYVTGNRHPDIDLQRQLADYFNVSMDYLVGRSDERGAPEKRFEASNIDLIRGKMSYSELSEDIARKLNFPPEQKQLFHPSYLESIGKGKIVPTPIRISLLASYAGVEQSFFFARNTSEDLIAAREEFRRIQKGKMAYHLDDQLYSFIMEPENVGYLKMAVEIKRRGHKPGELVSLSVKYDF